MTILNLTLFIALIVSTSYHSVPMNKLKVVGIFSLLAFAMIMKVYSLNCMVTGNCNTWTWIITIVSIVSLICAIAMVLTTLIQRKQLQNTLVTQQEYLRTMQERLFKEPFAGSDGGAPIELKARDEQDAI